MPSLIALFISFSVASLPRSLSNFITSVTTLPLFPCLNNLTSDVGAFLPNNNPKAPPTASPIPCPTDPRKNSVVYNEFRSSLSCNWNPCCVSKISSSAALPAAEPTPEANIFDITLLPPNKALKPFIIFNCGDRNVKAPAIGPAIPAKSAKSPEVNQAFSSITVFKLITDPSANFFCCTGKPSSSKPLGVNAIWPLVFLTKPSFPTLFSKTASWSSASSTPLIESNKFFKTKSFSLSVSALPRLDLRPLTLTPVS